MFDERRLTVGIIGAGDIVAKVHLPTLFTITNLAVSWLADVDAGKAEALGRSFGVKHRPLNSLSELPVADVVLLAIPYGVRDQYYSYLRDWQCALYVEKPFARSVARHRELCRWYPDYKLACGFQQRSWGPTDLLSKMIDDNLFGRLRSVRYGFGSPGAIVGGRYHSDVDIAGGGILFEVGVHGIDTLLFAAKAIAVDVNHVKMLHENGLDFHTEATMTVTTQQGDEVECQLTVTCLEETTGQLEFIFDNARVIHTYPGGLTVKSLRGKGSYEISSSTPVLPLTSFQTFHAHWSEFLSGVRNSEPNRTSAAQTALTTEVIEKLYQRGSMTPAQV